MAVPGSLATVWGMEELKDAHLSTGLDDSTEGYFGKAHIPRVRRRALIPYLQQRQLFHRCRDLRPRLRL